MSTGTATALLAAAYALTLNELQADIIEAVTREQPVVAVRAGWGSGKTSGVVFACLFVSQTRPGTSILLVTDTTDRFKGVLQPELAKWLAPLGWTFHTGDKTWTDPHSGSSIVTRSYYRPGTRSATHNPLEGLNITSGVAVIDECQTMQPEVAKKALGRLRNGDFPPTRVLVGLPVPDAWWVDLAAKGGDTPILHTSYVNKANLRDEWFDEIAKDDAEYRTMIMNEPVAAEGAVYPDWRPVAWPAGNLAPDGWVYSPEMTGRIAIDPGYKKPCALIIVHDPALGCDIIAAELNPKDVELDEFAALILRRAWPRSLANLAPTGRQLIWLDDGALDVAGNQRRNRTPSTAAKDLARLPADGGIGMRLRTTHDATKKDINNGVNAVRRRILLRGERRLLCAQDVWARGRDGDHNSIRRAFESYRYPKKGGNQPVKDGQEDPLDALRYDTIHFHWHSSPFHGRAAVTVSAPVPTRASKVVRGRRLPSSR